MVESKKIAAGVVELVNVGSQLIHKKGIGVVFQLSDEAMALGTINGQALKAEWEAGKVASNLKELLAFSKEKLSLENKDVEAKIKKCLDSAAKGVDVGKSALDLVSEVKQIFA